MIEIFRWVLTVFFLTPLLTWCFLNREDVPFDWSPVHDPWQTPLFGVILLAAILGFVWGVLFSWLNGWADWSARRQLKRQIKDLTEQLDDLQQGKITDNPEAVVAALMPPKKGWFGS